MTVGIQTIESVEDPRLRPYRTMRQQEDHLGGGIFVAEGEKVVRRLLESSLEVVSLVLPEKWFESYRPLVERRGGEVTVFVVPKPELEKLTGFSMYQGVLAVGRVPAPNGLEDVFAGGRRPLLLVAVDGLSSAENLCGIVRSAAGFGADAIVIGETSSHPYLRRAVRSSMGTVFGMPYIKPACLAMALKEMRDRGICCVAAHPHTNQMQLSEAEFKGDTCIVLGSEGLGIAPEVLDACDQWAAIPMHSGVDSLNVGTAAGIFLYEVARQRGLA